VSKIQAKEKNELTGDGQGQGANNSTLIGTSGRYPAARTKDQPINLRSTASLAKRRLEANDRDESGKDAGRITIEAVQERYLVLLRRRPVLTGYEKD
jgi:hypothetical protein